MLRSPVKLPSVPKVIRISNHVTNAINTCVSLNVSVQVDAFLSLIIDYINSWWFTLVGQFVENMADHMTFLLTITNTLNNNPVHI